MTENDHRTAEALEQLDYLTSSHNRLQVLEALTETTSKPWEESSGREPRELQDETGASEATVSRILNEFQERGWARRSSEGGYLATGRGEQMASHFDPILRSVEAMVDLEDVADLLPTDELTIDLRHFKDATIRRPQGPQPADFVNYLSEVIRETEPETGYVMTYTPVRPRTPLNEPVKAGEMTYITLLPESMLEFYLETPEDGEAILDMIDLGSRYFSYDGYFPCNLFIFDTVVAIENSQVDGVEDVTVIESRNEKVREWARELFDRYMNAAEELTPADVLD